MTKEVIMIDGVNVAGCDYLLSTGYCKIQTVFQQNGNEKPYGNFLECHLCKDCYYKQLQRKEQELEISKHYNNELTKYLLEIGDSFQIPPKMTILGKNCIEYYAILSSAIKSSIKDLQSENEKLKEKFKNLFDIDNQDCWDLAFLKDENAKYKIQASIRGDK